MVLKILLYLTFSLLADTNTELISQVNVLSEQISQLKNKLDSNSVVKTHNTAKDIKVEAVLDNIKTTFITWDNFYNIQQFYNSIKTTWNYFHQHYPVRKIIYKSIIVIIITLLFSTALSLLMIKALRWSKIYLETHLKIALFYMFTLFFCFMCKLFINVPLALNNMLYFWLLCMLLLKASMHFGSYMIQNKKNSITIIQRTIILTLRFLKNLIYSFLLLSTLYFWSKITTQNLPAVYQGAWELGAITGGVLFFIYVLKVRKPLNFLLFKFGVKKSLSVAVLLLWPWLIISLVWLILFMFVSGIKQFTFFIKSLLTASLLPLTVLLPRLIRANMLLYIKLQTSYKRNFLFGWYLRIKKYIIFLILSIQVWLAGLIWQVNITSNLIYIITPALYYTIYYLLMLILAVRIAQFCTGYIALSYTNKIREPVRKLLTIAAYGIIYITAGLCLLSILGFNTAWAGASFGLISAGLAFGIRDIINDMISGFLWALDNSFSLGDTLVIDEMQGIIEEMSIFALKLRLDNGTLMTFRYSFIQKLGSKSKNYAYSILNVSINYETDPEQAINLIYQAYEDVKKSAIGSKILAPIEIKGVDKLSSVGITIQARIQTMPKTELLITRMLNLQIRRLFEQANIMINLN